MYNEVLRQICYDYSALPPVREITFDEAEFYYDGLRSILKKATKPKDS